MSKCLISGLCIGLFCFLSYGQSSTSDETEITNRIALLYKGMVSKDRPTLENLSSEHLTYGHSSGTIENRFEYVEAVMSGPFDFLSIEPVDQRIQITGDTAVARHIFVAKGINDGVDTDVRIGVMMIWLKQNANWLLLARQAYKL